MSKTEFTNMVMIQDKLTGKVIVQERVKCWCGIAFPGGHIEKDESFVDSAVREIKEETGLTVFNLKSCGVVHWLNNKTFDRYIIFLYKTTDYTGDLLSETEEGKVFWVNLEELGSMKLSPNFKKYIPMFLGGKYNEAFGSWNDDEPWEIIFK